MAAADFSAMRPSGLSGNIPACGVPCLSPPQQPAAAGKIRDKAMKRGDKDEFLEERILKEEM